MGFKQIDITKLNENFIDSIGNEWMLITAGDEQKHNTMTASWGFMGNIWGVPTAVCVVRPQRYTKEFLENNEYFSLSFYGDNNAIHKVCGKLSGREVDKPKETGLIPVFDDDTVYYEQARLVLICKKMYVQEMKKECFVDPKIAEKWYDDDFHFVYVGEIVKPYINV